MALVLLALASVTLPIAARGALPRGVSPPTPIPIDAELTLQSTAFLHLAGSDMRIGFYAEGPARLAIDHRVVAEAPATGGEIIGTDPMAAGTHRVVLQYGPSPRNRPPILKWQRVDDAGSRNVPPDALAPRPLSPRAWRWRPYLQPAGLALSFAWIAVFVAIGAAGLRRWFARDAIVTGERRALSAVLSLSLLMAAYALWWGLPGGWAQDEIGPTDVLTGLARRFSGGWSFLRYPPFHFMLLSVAYSPVLLFGKLGLVDVNTEMTLTALAVIGRVLSVAMCLGTTAIAYLAGRYIASARTGVFAALFWSLVLTAAFYGKTVNLDVPATFWFALSFLAYLRVIRTGALGDHVLFGAAAAVAVCTKDQMYGFYAFPAIHLAILAARRRTTAAVTALAAGAAAGILVFAVGQNILFNPYGFVRHLESITGGHSEAYRMIERTSIAGQLWLLGRAGWQIVWSLSWPATIMAACGAISAFLDRPHRRDLIAALLAIASYYITFIAVVGYHYDRFFIPVCFLLALTTGRWLDRVLPAGGLWWKTAAAGAVLLYMAARTASLNVAMAADGRYETEDWLRANVTKGTSIATVEFASTLPRLHDYVHVPIYYPLTEFKAWNAPVAIVTTGYPDRFPPGAPEREWFESLVGGKLGYRETYRHKAMVPLAIVTWERTFRRPDPSFSTLHKINPEVIVLLRER